ncbi:YdeI/OmpD-associated family protein [Microbacterium proteolyticum]|uniref:YdeI/OmpD-associated family protein n=1 Tax=Microbacterium proteolyticum TaxID=1572644 RepID=UPI001FACA343|nr:YdeI/OmpD-associated family protein [Microbacterium proteolyticum]MCI9858286.1 YdeI/OmpD-associated family protein [Microbacterium proteolyticum]
MADIPELIVADVERWRAWLDENESVSDGVRVVLAKKGTTTPTTLTYAGALDEALCSGWIDGRRQSRDATTFWQHFTPRRSRSLWSTRNVDIVGRLADEGRMRPRGADEIAKAQADGRWDRAYAGPATIEVPSDLQAALDAVPAAARAFAALNKTQRYSVLHPVVTATTDTVRAARIARHIARLEVIGREGEGET